MCANMGKPWIGKINKMWATEDRHGDLNQAHIKTVLAIVFFVI